MDISKIFSNKLLLLLFTIVISISVNAQELTTKQLDSAFLQHPFKDRVEAIKNLLLKNSSTSKIMICLYLEH